MAESAASQLAALVSSANAYDHDRRHVHFDRIWQDPAGLGGCALALKAFFQEEEPDLAAYLARSGNRAILLSPDAIRSDFGIIPVSALLSSLIGCRFAVWKELADIRLGTSKIMGSSASGLSCIVLQDVVSSGATAIQIAQTIKALHWRIGYYVAAIYNDEDPAHTPEATLEGVREILGDAPRFRYVLPTSQISVSSDRP